MKKKPISKVKLQQISVLPDGRPNRQQQSKIQTLFHKNSSTRDLFIMNLDVYLATSSHKKQKSKTQVFVFKT